jgi:RHS repeat-associated protein
VFTKTASGVPFDGNGNILGLVNTATGTLDASYEYDPFGATIKSVGPAATTQPFGFSTKYTDTETSLCYYGFRYYCPATGRWLSRDPIEESGASNLYGFVLNDSMDYFDPLGREPQSPTPTLDPSGHGSQWRDPSTGQFAPAPQLPPPPGPGNWGPRPSPPGDFRTKITEQALKTLGNWVTENAFKKFVQLGKDTCRGSEPPGKGCKCCVIDIYSVPSGFAPYTSAKVYYYGGALLVNSPCPKVRDLLNRAGQIIAERPNFWEDESQFVDW